MSLQAEAARAGAAAGAEAEPRHLLAGRPAGAAVRRPALHDPATVEIQNLTGRRIAIRRGDGAGAPLVVAPLSSRWLPAERLQEFEVGEWEERGLVGVGSDHPPAPARSRLLPARWGQAALGLGVVLLLGLGVPAVAMWLVADLDHLDRPQRLGLLLEWIFLAVATVTPASFYFLFRRQRVACLRESFLRDVLQLDPQVRTVAEAKHKYRTAVEEVYPTALGSHAGHAVGVPIVVSTLLIAVGWTLALFPVGPRTAPWAATTFQPQPQAITYGFLGAYFFALNMLFRRYLRADMSMKAYNHITVRLLITIILVWAVGAMPPFAGAAPESDAGRLLAVLAFAIGIVPQTALNLIQQYLKQQLHRRLSSGPCAALEEADPLTVLEGVTLYDQARLLEEGVESVENLAHHNLVELMLRTRIPIMRLVDLYDQAVLHLHLHEADGLSADPRRTARAQMRSFGIRTATDLEEARAAAERRGPGELSAFLRLLDRDQDGDAGGGAAVPRLQVVMDVLRDDDWMPFLREWRRNASAQDQVTGLEAFPTAGALEAAARAS